MPERTYIENARLNTLFNKQRRHCQVTAKTTARERLAHLKSLEKAVMSWRPRIQEALYRDFGNPPEEVDMVDIYTVLKEIRYVRRHLRQWMRPVHVSTPLAFMGSRAYYFHEPKGISLIISPWNYPITLTLSPLVSALAAGCTAILKPSEHTPHATAVLEEMLGELFPEELVAVVPGAADTAQELLALPFNHIFFTGSTRVGKIVMAAAAQNLASVTLELGGKCPAIVDHSADILRTAHRIVQTKFTNAGQTCVAADYVLVHQDVYGTLLQALQDSLTAFYPSRADYEHGYSDLIHDQHLARMQAFLEDARAKGAHVVVGGEVLEGTSKLLPTILTHVSSEMAIMQEEIFGPILPVIPYATVDEARALIQNLEQPLGLYVFARGKASKDLLTLSVAGGSCINNCAMNYFNPNVPFGGVNHSGIGKSHGYAGFQAFSNIRPVYRQVWKYSPIDWLHPPYSKGKQWLIDFTLRWL